MIVRDASVESVRVKEAEKGWCEEKNDWKELWR